jgi:CBS domain-containing membrane protein
MATSALVLVAVGWGFHKLSGHAYPHVPPTSGVTDDPLPSQRDVISVDRDADPEVARQLLLDSGVRLLPVLDDSGRPVGGAGLRELARPARTVGDVMSPPLTTRASDPATELVGPLTDGHRHAAMVVDDDGRLIGLVAQADLLAARARPSVVA